MLDIKKEKIIFVYGKLNFNSKPLKIFDNIIINFLNEISLKIFQDKKNYKYPDLISFGFWCRKSNLQSLSRDYKSDKLIIGRGSVLHIAPSNVPMNFCFSMAFGLLSGNHNIIRLPTKNFIQINIVNNLIIKTLRKKKYIKIKDKICLIKYPKSDHISSELSKNVDARLLWGGDYTVSQFKQYQTSPRCIDLSFSNRYSISIINFNKLTKANSFEIKQIAEKFYNDCYIMDQQGCSSPQAIIWINGKNKDSKKIFWEHLNKIVEKKYDYNISVANKKVSSLFSIALSTDINFKLNYKNFKLLKLKVNSSIKELDKLQCHFGTIAEIDIKKLSEISKLINKKYQTITYFGIDNKDVEKIILKHGLKGIDRIVPIGRAFDMQPIWDGYNIINSLSRVVGN